ncbi:HAMP domain-containing sensor histidine kinase [Saccharibacillus alkalitolerans]|uniref:histidine kinase n=1 Tax=Saccharibacillus alkalitolerans TaxID=2705290 RepID=A0ABX0F7T9_9BACL|nr:HAMP domain-containing sensor histidine kinase [Saccharibacillus alkalitolerans]NGZ75648.1 HAMP domain-containing histidine kinase [Saccharibacillus alkalitolerans]
MILQTAGTNLLDRHFARPSFIAEQNQRTKAQLSQYIAQNRLSITDRDRLSDWVSKKKYVTIYIYQNKQLVYASDGHSVESQGLGSEPFVPDDSLYDLRFSDADTQLYLESYFEYKYYNIATFSCLAASSAFFLFLMLLFINTKTSYVEILENEIKILEGGNLEYPITIKGTDELASLAQSVNEMRKSFIERLENEEQARNANNELVTAMSHDLRTPLTALIGYLDIIQYRKYKTEEQLFNYIANSKDNAYRIKHLSDQLFEYFILSYSQNDPPELKEYDGGQLLDQFIGIHSPLLVDEGFLFTFIPCEMPFTVSVHVMSMQRVFDNLFSNVLKYADKGHEVRVQCTLHGEQLHIDVENRIDPNTENADSNGIGIKVCEKIVQNHKGNFEAAKTDDMYRVRISLPVHSNG